MTEACEFRWSNEKPHCRNRALARIRVGTRQADAQLSCGPHLARTCMILAYGDNGLEEPPKVLTVTMLGTV